MEINLKIGDKAVYPGQGVGQVTAIENKDILGSKMIFYSIRILKSGTKVMVPENRLKSIGVRPLISKKDTEKVLHILSQTSEAKKDKQKNWQKRHQAYMDKIKTGSIYEIAEVVRDLGNIQKDKELSYGEKRMMDKAQKMVFSELALTMDKKDFQESRPLSMYLC